MKVTALNELEKNLDSSQTSAERTNISTVSAPKFHKGKQLTENGGAYGTGRRKNSIARVWIRPGKGVITVNKKNIADYFPRQSYKTQIEQPFIDTKTNGQYDVVCTAKGGGTTGQAGAIIHGIARALDCISENFHDILHKNGFLTRDSRVVERKKYGKRKARKSTQFSKR